MSGKKPALVCVARTVQSTSLGVLDLCSGVDVGHLRPGGQSVLRGPAQPSGVSFVLPYHGHIRFRIVRHGYDVHPDVMIGGKQRIVALERGIQ